MALRVNQINFDQLTADPGTPAEGWFWYNTTDNQFKGYANSSTVVLSTAADLSSHVGDSNPHTVTLEQARTASATLAGAIAMGSNKITGIATPTASGDAATYEWVVEQINQRLRGLDWQESVIDKDLATAPGSPTTGDRYIIAGTGGGWSAGTTNDIAEWDGSAWVFSTPNEGFLTRVMDEDLLYVHDGTNWGSLVAATDHGSLAGLSDDDHTQYLLVSGTRAMTGALDMGSQNITSVGTVDGVTVSAHASRHERGGADEIDGDHLDIDFTPSNYTPSTTPAEAANVDDLAAHLQGIDTALGAGGGGGLETKAGNTAAGSFSGTPLTAAVAFSGAFSDTNYAVTLVCETDGTQFAPVFGSKATTGFTIHLGTSDSTGLTAVGWTATAHGET